jgi:hypothetical protein
MPLFSFIHELESSRNRKISEGKNEGMAKLALLMEMSVLSNKMKHSGHLNSVRGEIQDEI